MGKILELLRKLFKKVKRVEEETVLYSGEKITLIRTHSDDKGTLGMMFHNKDLICYTLELPWRDNARSISCIPAGKYICERWHSPTYGEVFVVTNVPNRTGILIHVGNWISDIRGCILPGTQQSIQDGGLDRYSVFNSGIALDGFMDLLKDEKEFQLEIKEIRCE